MVYELVTLLHPDLEIDLERPLKKLTKTIEDLGGTIIKTDNWGKRKLAYPIRKQDFAVYIYFEVELASDQVAKLDRTLNITDEVLRHLATKHVEPPVEEKKDDSKDEKSESDSASKKEGEE